MQFDPVIHLKQKKEKEEDQEMMWLLLKISKGLEKEEEN